MLRVRTCRIVQGVCQIDMDGLLAAALKQFQPHSGLHRVAAIDDAVARIISLMFSPALHDELQIFYKGGSRNEIDARLQKTHLFLDKYERTGLGSCRRAH